jgi:hypothetical protein
MLSPCCWVQTLNLKTPCWQLLVPLWAAHAAEGQGKWWHRKRTADRALGVLDTPFLHMGSCLAVLACRAMSLEHEGRVVSLEEDGDATSLVRF